MTNLPPAQTGLIPGFIPRKRYPMVASRQSIATDLISAGMERKEALSIAKVFGKILEKQATDEYLNYRAIESVFPISSKEYSATVVGSALAGYQADQVDFLATGTDDQIVINQAIVAAIAKQGDVLLLGGTYNLTGGLSASHFVSADRLHLHGVGMATILNAEGFTGTVIDGSIGESGPAGQWYTDFVIIGGGIGIDIASNEGIIERVCFQNQTDLIPISFNGSSSPMIIAENTFIQTAPWQFPGGGGRTIFIHNRLGEQDVTFNVSGSYISGNLITNADIIMPEFSQDNFVTLNDVLGGTVIDLGIDNIIFANRTVAGLVGMFQTYTHTQVAPLSTWTVIHNLGCFPSVTVTIGGGVVSIADVTYVDPSTLTITFSSAQSGLAYLN